jgi:hypothetical protein
MICTGLAPNVMESQWHAIFSLVKVHSSIARIIYARERVVSTWFAQSQANGKKNIFLNIFKMKKMKRMTRIKKYKGKNSLDRSLTYIKFTVICKKQMQAFAACTYIIELRLKKTHGLKK